MLYLLRLSQVHDSFRKAELEAIAANDGLEISFVLYDLQSPFCILELDSDETAIALVSRSILSQSIYELWGKAPSYDALHAELRQDGVSTCAKYTNASFRFTFDTYLRKRPSAEQREIVESFSYLPLHGPIQMRGADLELCVLEDYPPSKTNTALPSDSNVPSMIYLGRFISSSARETIHKYDLKKRSYISTTSMDAELSLITANLTLAAPGKIIYDPFMGTGSLLLACAHFGATTLGSDIDGRSIRGKGARRNVLVNFAQYGLKSQYLDGFTADLTNSPVRSARWLDGIVCDPPYGVREGLKVLGSKSGRVDASVLKDGMPAHLHADYVPAKRAYSFEAMLDDILDYAATMLVDHGRLSMWMPTTNEDDRDLDVPLHASLELVSNCVQPFNKWSRRLLTYSRLPDSKVATDATKQPERSTPTIRGRANDLNPFRRKYFEGFKPPS